MVSSQIFDRSFERKLVFLNVIPAVIACVVYELFLGHRHDYTGHFAAGYGASLSAGALWLMSRPQSAFPATTQRHVVPLCLLFVGLGVITEATVFRIAKFDEIDFCNQSLGAVLACASLHAYASHPKLPRTTFGGAIVAGFVFLAVGGVYAVA